MKQINRIAKAAKLKFFCTLHMQAVYNLVMTTPDDPTIRYYNANSPELSRRYESADVPTLQERLLEIFPEGSRLLEIGCGSGREAAFLLSRGGYELYCVEASRAMIDRAHEYHPELMGRIFQGRVPGGMPERLLQNHDGSWDGIYAMASLMHLGQDEVPRTLELFYRLLKKGGRILFSVPLSRPDLGHSGFDAKGRYFLLLPEEEWTGMVGAAGFSGIETSTNPDGMGREAITWLSCAALK